MGISRIGKHFSKLIHRTDLSHLLKVVVLSSLHFDGVDLTKLESTLLSPCLSLDSSSDSEKASDKKSSMKLTFTFLETAISVALSNEDKSKRCLQILNFLKKEDESAYNQALLFILKQSKDAKDKIIKIISGEQHSNILFADFGGKEFSLLSALASQHKITKINAL